MCFAFRNQSNKSRVPTHCNEIIALGGWQKIASIGYNIMVTLVACNCMDLSVHNSVEVSQDESSVVRERESLFLAPWKWDVLL